MVAKWDTLEKIQPEADKYHRRGDFAKGSPSAYNAAWERGGDFLDSICNKMKPSRGSSREERELFQEIKKFKTNIKKIRDNRVKIKDRPYIKGFEIDMFDAELNKGIEFDGTYYHSFEYMRKDKRKKSWSDEDICNYHKLKDDWFASKGIQILHIKEEEWNLNKESCILRCLEFLGIK